MKKILVLVLVSMVFISCEYTINTYPEYQNMEQNTREIDSLEFANLKEVFEYLNLNIKYASDEKVHRVSDYWQAPHETLDRKTGDCEDLCVFVAYFAVQLGHKVEIVCGVEDPKKNSGHTILKIDDQYFEYTGRKIDNYLYNCAYLTLDEALSVCYNKFGSRSVEKNLVLFDII